MLKIHVRTACCVMNDAYLMRIEKGKIEHERIKRAAVAKMVGQ